MIGARLASLASTVAFALLAIALVAVGAVSVGEALCAALAVAIVFVPSGWWTPGGALRRWSEATLVPAALALTLVRSPTMRQMVVAPLLVAALWAVATAATRHRPPTAAAMAAILGIAIRVVGGLGLGGQGLGLVIAAFAVAAFCPWVIGRRLGGAAGQLSAVAVSVVPCHLSVALGAILVVAVLLLAPFVLPSRDATGVTVAWIPGIAGCALFATALAPWGGIAIERAFPDAGWPLLAGFVVVLALAPRLPPAVAGAVWMLVVLLVGPAPPPSPDRGGVAIEGEHENFVLPPATGDPYVIDLAVRSSTKLPAGTPVAFLRFAGSDHELFLGVDAADWRPTSRGAVVGAPADAALMWRPRRSGSEAVWQPALRRRYAIPVGDEPVITRHPELPETATLRLETGAPAGITPPRDWRLAAWMAAAAVAVMLVQLLGGTWRRPCAALPWTILVFGTVLTRAHIEPLRVLSERLSVDLALAALVAAWLPAARALLARRRVFVAVAALLVPLAVATPHLTPSMYGDEPFHLVVMESLAGDHDLDIANNLDLDHHPQQRFYLQGDKLFHSPVLGIALAPAYLVAGRTGALVSLAVLGALLAALVAVRARALGVPDRRIRLLVVVVASTYPLATFATQIWPELPGACAVAAILVVGASGSGRKWLGLGLAMAMAAVKTRLGLIAFPAALAGWWRRDRRHLIRGTVAAVGASVIVFALGWLTMGHPFGPYRRLRHLIPNDPLLALRVVGGLAFDVAGGFAFTAPLALVAIAGIGVLWRRGGTGERAALIGSGLTVAALLSSSEWYGGGAPPARYLVAVLPIFALTGGVLLTRPGKARRMSEILIVPSIVAWWALVTRPQFSVNSGDGGHWLPDALARRLGGDARSLFPSFLIPDTATLVVPIVLIALAFGVMVVARRRPAVAVWLRRASVALWLAAAAGLVVTTVFRYDTRVEAEAPQVRRRGGSRVPGEGTVARFTHRNGWRLADGDMIIVPLHLPPDAAVWLEGWLEGPATRGSVLEIGWDDGGSEEMRVRGANRNGRIRLVAPRDGGRHRLRIEFCGPPEGAAVLDCVVIERP